MKLRRVLLAGTGLLLACAGVGPIDPEEGDYVVTITDVELSDACEAIWLVDVHDELLVEVELTDNEVEFIDIAACARDEASFTCESENERGMGDIDAVITESIALEGRFLTSTAFEADTHGTLSCDGADCGDYATDCTSETRWEGERDR